MAKRESLDLSSALEYSEEEVHRIINATNKKRSYYAELTSALTLETAIFLTQVEWRWINNGSDSFYKYIDECESCRVGDSWSAELGFTPYQVRSILKTVGTRVTTDKKARELLEKGTELQHIVVYRKPAHGAMRWYFNEALFNKLRSKLIMDSLGPNLKTRNLAKVKNPQLGQSEKTASSIIHNSSEPTQNFRDENFSENEESSDILEKLESDDWKNPKSSEKKRGSTKSKNQRTKKKTDEQLNIIKNHQKGKVMELDFSVRPSIMAEALEKYKDQEWLDGEEKTFRNWYTNVRPDISCLDWSLMWLNAWLPKSWQGRKTFEKNYGKKQGTRKDAGAERLEGLRTLADPSFATDVAGKSLDELGENLRRYYDSVDDGSDS